MNPMHRRVIALHLEHPKKTIADIARMAGCSYSVAHNALSPKAPKKSPKFSLDVTTAHIAVERKGYVPVSLPAFPRGEK